MKIIAIEIAFDKDLNPNPEGGFRDFIDFFISWFFLMGGGARYR
jgi:hypothetical protein